MSHFRHVARVSKYKSGKTQAVSKPVSSSTQVFPSSSRLRAEKIKCGSPGLHPQQGQHLSKKFYNGSIVGTLIRFFSTFRWREMSLLSELGPSRANIHCEHFSILQNFLLFLFLLWELNQSHESRVSWGLTGYWDELRSLATSGLTERKYSEEP